MLMAVYVAPDGVFEMAKTFTLTGPKRRNSTHGDETRALPASRKRKRSI